MSNWNLKQTEGDAWESQGYSGTYGHTEYTRSIHFASEGYDCDGGACTEEGKHYNGSGPQAFGGAKEWPHVKLSVGLPVDRYDLRTRLASRLRDTVDAFVAEYELEPGSTPTEREVEGPGLSAEAFLIELQYVDCGGCVDGDCPHETAHECTTALIEELTRIATLAKRLVPRTDEG